MTNLDIYYHNIQEAKEYIERAVNQPFPKTVLVTGTGLASIVEVLESIVVIGYEDIPHFPTSTVTSHAGNLHICKHGSELVAILAGRWHYYEGYSTKDFTLPIRVMKALGAEEILFTNVAGGVNESYEAGDLVMITDHINTIPDHPLRGPNDERLGLRFPDMLAAYDKNIQDNIRKSAMEQQIKIQEGVYYALQGPSLETPAEYTMIHRLGADLVGMSTVPEVIVAKHAGLRVGAISIVSNVCYPPERITNTTIEEVIEVAGKASLLLNKLLLNMIGKSATNG